MAHNDERVALVTGATGYIGSNLVTELLKDGWAVKAFSRDRDKALELPWGSEVVAAGKTATAGQVEVIEGDFEDSASLDEACERVDVAWYLVHSMSGGSDFREQDRAMAQDFADAASRAGIGRIVYLSGLHPTSGELSEHLESRVEVGEILLNSGIPTAVLQAGIVLGDGSESFSMLRHTAERLPGVVGPDWMKNEVTPISIKDALFYLKSAADLDADQNRTFDIGARESIPYKEMIRQYGQIALKVPRVIAVAPVMTQRMAASAIALVTPLIQSLKHDTVVKERDLEALLGEPTGGVSSFERAVKDAMRTVDTGRWMRTVRQVGLAVGACAVAGSILSDPESSWYKKIEKPSWQPPALAFPIVWTALYADIAAVSALVIADAHEVDDEQQARNYWLALGGNLVLNAAWSGLFFRSKMPALASAEALALAASSADLVRRAAKSSPERGVVLAPYAAWTGFAFVLNSSIAYLNRPGASPRWKFWKK